MKASFTGTQAGMTSEQHQSLTLLVEEFLQSKSHNIEEWHHGGCVGADEEAHAIAINYHIPVHVHRGSTPSKYGFTKGASVIYPAIDNLERNGVMAEVGEVMFATPREFHEVLRSGTWSTIRRARKLDRYLYVIQPDGQLHNYYSKTLAHLV